MDVEGKVVVITGRGSGIGKTMAQRFRRGGARGIVVADLNGEAAETVAISCLPFRRPAC